MHNYSNQKKSLVLLQGSLIYLGILLSCVMFYQSNTKTRQCFVSLYWSLISFKFSFSKYPWLCICAYIPEMSRITICIILSFISAFITLPPNIHICEVTWLCKKCLLDKLLSANEQFHQVR